MSIAGKILITPRGEYNEYTTYSPLDLVSHNGTSWLAKKEVVGIEPKKDNNEFWHNMFNLNIINNLTTTTEGGVLDARQGKILADMFGGYYFISKRYQGRTNASGFLFIEENLQNSMHVLSSKPLSLSGNCVPYYIDNGNVSFLIKQSDETICANSDVEIEVFYAIKQE